MVARSNADLQRVIDQVVAYEGIVRASTIIALAEQIPYRVLPLVRAAATLRRDDRDDRDDRDRHDQDRDRDRPDREPHDQERDDGSGDVDELEAGT